MKLSFSNIALVALTCALPLISAWDAEGHRVVARIAGRLIKPKTARYVRQHLPLRARTSMRAAEGALVQASSWADTSKDMYPWSAPLHYSDTPYRDCQPFVLRRDCGSGSGRCIVTGIANYTARAADIALPESERTEAIKFLIHFLADIHQPLHTGFAEDHGATGIHLADPDISLHETWDTLLLRNHKDTLMVDRDNSWYGVASELSQQLLSNRELLADLQVETPTPARALAFAIAIASETTSTLTCRAYRDDPIGWIPERGHTLSDVYMRQHGDAMMRQFQKAGVRLAQLLDAVAAAYYAAEQANNVPAEAAPVAGAGAAGSNNRFAPFAMEMDFDVEDVVFEAPDESAPDDYETEGHVPVHPVVVQEPSSIPTAPVALTTPIPLTANQKKKAAALRKKERDEVAKRTVDGVDVSRVVMIKRERQYVITYESFVIESPMYAPLQVQPVLVRFKGSDKPVKIVLDRLTGATGLSLRLLLAVFRHLKGMPYSPDVLDALTADMAETDIAMGDVFGNDKFEVPPLLQQLFESLPAPVDELPYWKPEPALGMKQLKELYPRRVPSVEERAEAAFKSSCGDVTALMEAGEGTATIWLITRLDWLANTAKRQWVFNKFYFNPDMDSRNSTGEGEILYIDVRLYDGPMLDAALLETMRHSAAKGKAYRNLCKIHVPILANLLAISRMLAEPEDVELAKAVAVGVESIWELERDPESDQADLETIQITLRTREDEKETAKRLGVPIPPKRKLNDELGIHHALR